jgi:hypothetical protein
MWPSTFGRNPKAIALVPVARTSSVLGIMRSSATVRPVQRVGELRAAMLGLRQGLRWVVHPEHRITLHDRPSKQTARQRRGHHRPDAQGTRRLSEDRDVPGITTETSDIGLNPAQRGGHVEQAVIA